MIISEMQKKKKKKGKTLLMPIFERFRLKQRRSRTGGNSGRRVEWDKEVF